MRWIPFLMVFAASLAIGADSQACVGKTLVVGTTDVASERLLAEAIAVLVNERTGTTVKVEVFSNADAIYEAVKTGKVSIVVENTARALKRLGLEKGDDAVKSLLAVREGYREKLGLVWLDPTGLLAVDGDKQVQVGPVISTDVMRKFPVLPRVVNKLAPALTTKVLEDLVATVASGKEAKAVVREFLIEKRLI